MVTLPHMSKWDTGRTVKRILVKMFALYNIYKQATTFSLLMLRVRYGGAKTWPSHDKGDVSMAR